jgi:hypothetical protein
MSSATRTASILCALLLAACGGGGGSRSSGGPVAGGSGVGGGGTGGGTTLPPDPSPVDFDRFGLREPAAATLAAFESGGQLAQAAADAIARAASTPRFPTSLPCAAGTTDTTTDAVDLDFTDANQDGRVGPGDTLRATFRDCRSAAFGGARLTGLIVVNPQSPAPYSGPDPPDETLDLLTRATALRARWAAAEELVLDGPVASRHLVGRPFRAMSWTTNATPLRVTGRRDPFAFDLALRNARAAQYHDYREARTSPSLEGEVLAYGSAGGFRVSATSTAISLRLNQFPQSGTIVLRGAGRSRAGLVARVGELSLELDSDGDGTYETRNAALESWTLGSRGFLFWDPFTGGVTADGYALGTNPDDTLRRLVALPAETTGTPVFAPTQAFRQYWSRPLDAASIGTIRFVAVPAGTSVPAIYTIEGALLDFAPATPLQAGASYEARTDGPLGPGMGTAGAILASFSVATALAAP